MSEESRTTSSSRLSQFGIYRNIDARTEDFLRLSRKRQIRQVCACAAVSTAITVTVVITVLLIYEYTTNLDTMESEQSRQSNWHNIFNNSLPFDKYNKAKVNINPSVMKLLPLILKVLNHNRFFEKIVDDNNSQTFDKNKIEVAEPIQNAFRKKLVPKIKMRVNSSLFNKMKNTELSNKQRTNKLEDFRKIQHTKEYQRVLNYFDKMINVNTHDLFSRDTDTNKSSSFNQIERTIPFSYFMGDELNDTDSILESTNSNTVRISSQNKDTARNNTYIPKTESLEPLKSTNNPKHLTEKWSLKNNNNISNYVVQKSTTQLVSNAISMNKSFSKIFTPLQITNPQKSSLIKKLQRTETKAKIDANHCNCKMSKNLKNLLQKLDSNIREIIPELNNYNNRCQIQGQNTLAKNIFTTVKPQQNTTRKQSITLKTIYTTIKPLQNNILKNLTTLQTRLSEKLNAMNYQSTTQWTYDKADNYVSTSNYIDHYLEGDVNKYVYSTEPINIDDEEKLILFDKLLHFNFNSKTSPKTTNENKRDPSEHGFLKKTQTKLISDQLKYFNKDIFKTPNSIEKKFLQTLETTLRNIYDKTDPEIGLQTKLTSSMETQLNSEKSTNISSKIIKDKIETLQFHNLADINSKLSQHNASINEVNRNWLIRNDNRLLDVKEHKNENLTPSIINEITTVILNTTKNATEEKIPTKFSFISTFNNIEDSKNQSDTLILPNISEKEIINVSTSYEEKSKIESLLNHSEVPLHFSELKKNIFKSISVPSTSTTTTTPRNNLSNHISTSDFNIKMGCDDLNFLDSDNDGDVNINKELHNVKIRNYNELSDVREHKSINETQSNTNKITTIAINTTQNDLAQIIPPKFSLVSKFNNIEDNTNQNDSFILTNINEKPTTDISTSYDEKSEKETLVNFSEIPSPVTELRKLIYSSLSVPSTTTTTTIPRNKLSNDIGTFEFNTDVEYNDFKFLNEEEDDSLEGFKYPIPDKYELKNEIQTDQSDSTKYIKSMLPISRPIYLEIHRGDWKHDENDFENPESFD